MTNSSSTGALMSSATDLLVEAGLLLPTGKRTIIFVEGDSDRRLYESAFKKDVSVLPAGNYAKVEEVINLYDASQDFSKLPMIVGVVDRDYRIAAGQASKSPNLIYTELRDIECEMIQTEAFDHVVSEYCSQKFRNTWTDIMVFRRTVLNATAEIGKVRLYNHVKQTKINFQQLDFSKFFCFKQHALDGTKLISHLRGAQKSGTKTPANFQQVANFSNTKQYRKHSAPLRLTRGHDVFALLQLYFQKGFGRNGAAPDLETLESSIRIGFRPYMKASPTVQKLIAWFGQFGPQNSLR